MPSRAQGEAGAPVARTGVAEDGPLAVTVAVLTCRRPAMLTTLLEALAAIEVPGATEVSIVVVDNDAAASARTVIERSAGRPGSLRYVVETRPGIPYARNRAVLEAIDAGADLLAFIDDDEYPAATWLAELVQHWRRTRAELIGGPVLVAPAAAGASPWGRLVNRSLQARMVRKNRRTARAARRGRGYTIVTNNWLCDVAWLRASGLRFDERLQFTGGSDTRFCHEARRLGAQTGWCASAIVYEAMEPERLTLRYQFHRAAMQSIQNFHRSHDRVSAATIAEAIAMASLRFVTGSLLLAIPVMGVASPSVAIRSLGWATGRIRALAGARSTLYARQSDAQPAADERHG